MPARRKLRQAPSGRHATSWTCWPIAQRTPSQDAAPKGNPFSHQYLLDFQGLFDQNLIVLLQRL